MAAGRHNLSRRAVLGAVAGACALRGRSLAAVAIQTAAAERGQVRVPVPWTRALAAFRRAEARLASLPPGVSDDLFDTHECARLAALHRLLRAPAPDLAALSLKLDLAIADAAWELTGAEPCLAALKADARRFARCD